MNFKKIALVASVDILLLSELTVSLYLAHLQPEAYTLIFLKTFLPMAAATLLAGRLITRRLFPQVLAESAPVTKGESKS